MSSYTSTTWPTCASSLKDVGNNTYHVTATKDDTSRLRQSWTGATGTMQQSEGYDELCVGDDKTIAGSVNDNGKDGKTCTRSGKKDTARTGNVSVVTKSGAGVKEKVFEIPGVTGTTEGESKVGKIIVTVRTRQSERISHNGRQTTTLSDSLQTRQSNRNANGSNTSNIAENPHDFVGPPGDLGNVLVPQRKQLACVECDETFKSFAQLRGHTTLYHSKKLLYEQTAKYLTYKAYNTFCPRARVKLRKVKKNPYQCETCKLVFKRYIYCRNHVLKKHDKHRQNSKHWMLMHSKQMSMLSNAVKLAKNRRDLRSIRAQYSSLSTVDRGGNSMKGLTEKCPLCQSQFNHRIALMMHLRKSHNAVLGPHGSYRYIGKQVGFRSREVKTMTRAYNSARRKCRVVQPGKKLHQCVDCHVRLSHANTLLRHLKVCPCGHVCNTCSGKLKVLIKHVYFL